MSEGAVPGGPANTGFQNMTDSQLRQTISQLSNAAGRAQLQNIAPAPGAAHAHPAYFNNITRWSTSVTPPPMNGRTNPSRKSRPIRSSTLAATPQAVASTSSYQSQPAQTAPPASTPTPVPVQENRLLPLTPIPQALHSTYASRLRTGVTLLVQPIFGGNSTTAIATRNTRRSGAINYAEPGSGDEFLDAGAIESDDSDFIASGGTRTALRNARLSSRAPVGAGVFSAGGATTIVTAPPPQPTIQPKRSELDQSYLGMIPPARFISAKPVAPTKHDYFSPDMLELQARKPVSLVPIRVEFETDTLRIRDCFVWNLHEDLIQPETFARTFCTDLELPLNPWAETVANQIRAQIEEHEPVASMDLGMDGFEEFSGPPGEDIPDCRVILSIDVQIATYHLLDHIEWDLLSPLTPEAFASTLCADLGLSGEAVPLVAHAIHEELIKHKRDAVEWGVIGADLHTSPADEQPDRPRDRSGLSLLKDKTGLGLGWGRTPKDGRGPKPLRSVWRDWAEAEEFRTRFEVLSVEEVERREIERERASRRLRRETSKFQNQSSRRRR